jgi:ABC-type branched-subunit amino acid transport system ATPase component
MTGVPLLELDGLSKSFGGLTALTDVSFQVFAGEICGVIGPNGAGKSTLFNLIAGSMPPSSGKVIFAGEDVSGISTHGRARKGIVRTFQLAHTFETMTVADNVLVGAEDHSHLRFFEAATHLGGFADRAWAARRRAQTAMATVGIESIAARMSSRLTFGQQRLVATARALAAQPKLLLLDEPAAGLSTGDIEALCAAIDRARAAGTTVLIVEHNMDVIMRLCEHIVVMHLGRKIGDGPPRSIRESEQVLEAYLGA